MMIELQVAGLMLTCILLGVMLDEGIRVWARWWRG